MKTTPTITLTRPNGEARTLVVEVIDAVEARGRGARVRIVPPSGEAHDLVVRESFVEVCTKICRATLRRAEVRQPDGSWFEVPIPHIGAGDVYRLFEADGRPVDLGMVCRATRGAYPDPDGRWVVEGDVVERPEVGVSYPQLIVRLPGDVERRARQVGAVQRPGRVHAIVEILTDDGGQTARLLVEGDDFERVREWPAGCAHAVRCEHLRLFPADVDTVHGGAIRAVDETGNWYGAVPGWCKRVCGTTEPCSHCHVEYPAPVGHHHTEEECSANRAGWTLDEEQAMLARAREQGAGARRAGEPRDPTPDGQGRAWAEGWDEEDAVVRAQAREQGAVERRAGTNRGYAPVRVAGWVLPLGLDESIKEWRAGWDAEDARIGSAPTKRAADGVDPTKLPRGEQAPAPPRSYAFLVADLAATFGDRLTRVERGPRRFSGWLTPTRDPDNHLDIDVTDLTDAERDAIVAMVGRVPVVGGRWEVLFNSHTAKSWTQPVKAPDARRGADGGIPVVPGDPLARAGTTPNQGVGAGEPAPNARPA